MRRAARVDDNHSAIVTEFRRCGVTVKSLAQLGGGVPDLLCSVKPPHSARGITWLVEVKDGAKVPSKRRLTEGEADFHARWPGDVFIVEHANDVPAVVLAACNGFREEEQ